MKNSIKKIIEKMFGTSEQRKNAPKTKKKCNICGKEFEASKYYWGNDPWPLSMNPNYDKGYCCDSCNAHIIAPVRANMNITVDYDGKSITDLANSTCKTYLDDNNITLKSCYSVEEIRELLKNGLKRRIWVDSYGKTTPIKDMSTRYIKNCIKAVKKEKIKNSLYGQYIPLLEGELLKRHDE